MQPSIQNVGFFCPQRHISGVLFSHDASAFTAAAPAAHKGMHKQSLQKKGEKKNEKESVQSTAEGAATNGTLLDQLMSSSHKSEAAQRENSIFE